MVLQEQPNLFVHTSKVSILLSQLIFLHLVHISFFVLLKLSIHLLLSGPLLNFKIQCGPRVNTFYTDQAHSQKFW